MKSKSLGLYRCIFAFFSLLFLVSNAHSEASVVSKELKPLLKAIDERLGYMHGVALYKWHNNKLILDAKREKEVLKNVVSLAEEAGLETESAKVFFSAQITAAKEIQAGWHNAWKEGKSVPAKQGPNLVTEIRPALNRLGADIITLLVEKNGSYRKANKKQLCVWLSESLNVKYLPSSSKQALCEALHNVKLN